MFFQILIQSIVYIFAFIFGLALGCLIIWIAKKFLLWVCPDIENRMADLLFGKIE